ncbi:hypothetical protein ACFY4A_42490, partial [Streptomyces sp. NPDC001292]
MTENPNELTIDNSAVVLIDHQPGVALMTTPRSPADLVNNVAGLAETAKALGVPTVLTTIGATGGPLVDPIFKEIRGRADRGRLGTPATERAQIPVIMELRRSVTTEETCARAA